MGSKRTSSPARPLLAALSSVACLMGFGLAAGPALAADSEARDSVISDPFEGFNREMFGFNKAADRAVVRPVAMTYRRLTPTTIRESLHNVVANLGEPVTFLNDVLQVQPGAAASTAARFGVNSTLGFAGAFDPASSLGVYHHHADFGQTLGRYGVASGPYLVLPLVGPSSLRDTVGLGFDAAANPFNYARFDGDVAVKLSVIAAAGLDARVRADRDLKDFQSASTDPYAAARSIWVQNRAYQIRGEKPADVQSLPDFDSAPASAAPKT